MVKLNFHHYQLRIPSTAICVVCNHLQQMLNNAYRCIFNVKKQTIKKGLPLNWYYGNYSKRTPG